MHVNMWRLLCNRSIEIKSNELTVEIYSIATACNGDIDGCGDVTHKPGVNTSGGV